MVNDTVAKPDQCVLGIRDMLIEVIAALCLRTMGIGEWKKRCGNLDALGTLIGTNGSISVGEDGIRGLVGPVVLEEILEAAVVDDALCAVDDGQNLLRPRK